MKYDPINKKCPHMLHGGDYNPDQWLHMPEIIDDDFRLMKLAGCNTMTVGIFAWSILEPEDGVYNFTWLDEIMDRLAEQDAFAVLATPSGARPVWMTQKYPEVLRYGANRVRNLFGTRHNHCYTSPIYRQKVGDINRRLAERYKDHPALLLWHLSNEYGGECYCPLCEEKFRLWLKNKYNNDIKELNIAWNASFWSHNYNDWSQIEAPAPHGEMIVHGMNLDWKRFVSDRHINFMSHEISAIREYSDAPVTTNMMGFYPVIDYFKMAEKIDVISWDSYPSWHHKVDDVSTASYSAFVHNLNRSMKGGKPFMLMESTPSATNWQDYAKLKRPGMHLLSSLQAIAHGSDTVQYFQWRKSRGSNEKFHGAVVDHVGNEHNRVFRDVAKVGSTLAKLDDIVGTTVPTEVAIFVDWENMWAINDAKGPRNDGGTKYLETCHQHITPFWKLGVPFDVVDSDSSIEKYKLLIIPMLYMTKPGIAEKLESFVENGGTIVTTYMTGWVNETDLCHLGGFPGPLRKLCGIWSEEIDCLTPGETNPVAFLEGNHMSIAGVFDAHTYCEIIHPETAKVLACYTSDFYSGSPAMTVNKFGNGKVYYMATRFNDDLLDQIYEYLILKLKLRRSLNGILPYGVTANYRTDGNKDYIFVMNFTDKSQSIALSDNTIYNDMFTHSKIRDNVELNAYGLRILIKDCLQE